MKTLSVRSGLGALMACGLALGTAWAAEPASKATPTSTKSGTPSRTAAKGPLPDPALLDGSALPAEKRSEHGMIGDFELPGDENARGDRVGGPQNPNGGAPGTNINIPLPIPIPGLPQMGGGVPGQQGGAGGLPNPLGGAAGGAGAAGSTGALPQIGGAQGGGADGGAQAGQPGGQPGGAAQGGPIQGAGDPNATAQGVQVGQLGGEGSQDGQGGQGGSGRPPTIAIGDSAMRIGQPAGGTPGVVGTQLPPGPVQQHDRGTGTGGRAAGGSGANKGVERGRAIPSGL